jgi:hypothetical protein
MIVASTTGGFLGLKNSVVACDRWRRQRGQSESCSAEGHSEQGAISSIPLRCTRLLIALDSRSCIPESEEPRTLVEKLFGAEIAIAIEGSVHNHCWVAMPPRSTFVAIQPPTRFNSSGKMRADAIGINWAYVVADPHPDGFCLPTDRLLRTIDEVVRVAAARRS